MFKDDINRKINGVIKVDQDNTDALIQKLDEYVITKELKKHFIAFFKMRISMRRETLPGLRPERATRKRSSR